MQTEALVCLIKISGLRNELGDVEFELNNYIVKAQGTASTMTSIGMLRGRPATAPSSRIRSRYEVELAGKITDLIGQRQKIKDQIISLQAKLEELLPGLEESLALS